MVLLSLLPLSIFVFKYSYLYFRNETENFCLCNRKTKSIILKE